MKPSFQGLNAKILAALSQYSLLLQETEDVFVDDSDELQEKKRAAFWKTEQFRAIYVPISACTLLLSAAIALRLYKRHLVLRLPSPHRHGWLFKYLHC